MAHEESVIRQYRTLPLTLDTFMYEAGEEKVCASCIGGIQYFHRFLPSSLQSVFFILV